MNIWRKLFGRQEDLSALLKETASLRKRLAPMIIPGLSPQAVAGATAILRRAEGRGVKRLAAQKRRNENDVEWNTPDEQIYLARLVLEEAKQLRIVLELNGSMERMRF